MEYRDMTGRARLIGTMLAALLCLLQLGLASQALASSGDALGSSGAGRELALGAQSDLAAGDALSYATDGDWKLGYTVAEDGTCVIVGVLEAGSGSAISIPSEINGHTVTEIRSQAFYGGTDGPSKSLTSIVLPGTINTIGEQAFMGSGIESMSIPASVQSLPKQCFAGCKALAQVAFEGSTLGNIGDQAFSGCSALKQLEIPVLTTNIYRQLYRVGRSCFYRCSALETIVFKGNSATDSGRYISNSDCFDGCESLKNLVYYCKRSTIPRGTGSDSTLEGVNEYRTMWFYTSIQDAKEGKNPKYYITCHSTTKIADVLSGKVDSTTDVKDEKGVSVGKRIWDEQGTRPELEEGTNWGVYGAGSSLDDAALANTYAAIPVLADNLDYGWVSSLTITKYWETHDRTSTSSGDPTYYLDNTGNVVGLDDMAAFGSNGVALPVSSYTLRYQLESVEGTGARAVRSYDDIAGLPAKAGTYRVRAEGATSSNEGTATPWVFIAVQVFEPTIETYSSSDVAARMGSAAHAAARAVRGKAKSAVVVPADDWRYQLIGAGLAGTGQGLLLFDNKSNYSSRSVTAFVESGTDSVQVVGSTNAVPESRSASSEVYLMDYLSERSLQYKTRYSKDATVQQLADEVYTTIRSLKAKDNTVYGDGWGTTAIVASPVKGDLVLSAGQYAYLEKAPVFFVGDDGMLGTADAGYLKADGFTRVVVLGGADYVSDACVAAVKSATGLPVERIFVGSDLLSAALSGIGALSSTPESVAIANVDDPCDMAAACMAAATRGGVALPCGGTADSKRIQDYLRSYIAKNGQTSVAELYCVGDFSKTDSGLGARLSAMWASPKSTKIDTGDTFASGDFVMQISGASTVSIARLRDASATSATVQKAVYGSSTYVPSAVLSGAIPSSSKLSSITFGAGVTAVPAGAFKGLKGLASVNLGNFVKTIGANAFQSCAKLTSVKAPAVTAVGKLSFAGCTTLRSAVFAKATSLGASAFSGCTALAVLSAPKVKTIGASAFSGCTKLVSSTSMRTATSIGASAYAKCTSLRAASLPKATSIAASAFAGCTKLTAVLAPKAKTIGASVFKGCRVLKRAEFTSASLTKIGARAFYGCKKLSKLKLKTKKLNASRVGAKAFTGMPSTASVFVPKAKQKAYKKLFVKKGLAKKAKFRAV